MCRRETGHVLLMGFVVASALVINPGCRGAATRTEAATQGPLQLALASDGKGLTLTLKNVGPSDLWVVDAMDPSYAILRLDLSRPDRTPVPMNAAVDWLVLSKHIVRLGPGESLRRGVPLWSFGPIPAGKYYARARYKVNREHFAVEPHLKDMLRGMPDGSPVIEMKRAAKALWFGTVRSREIVVTLPRIKRQRHPGAPVP